MSHRVAKSMLKKINFISLDSEGERLYLCRSKNTKFMTNKKINPYSLPINWDKKEIISFGELSSAIEQIHFESQHSAIKSINRYTTIRNYLIGFYIVEHEQKGNDRATYGERLLKRLADNISIKGINETLLKNCRRFYILYPQVKQYLENGKSPTPSDQFTNNANDIINKLSFSHIIEIMTINDSFARFFYETECMRSSWNVKELRRQISTNLYFRCGISKNPELLLYQTIQNQTPELSIRDPFFFEFLGLDIKTAMSESDLEEALISHLQDFILELGKGFCFVARQKRITIEGDHYYVDLVFYNYILKCFVVIELKTHKLTYQDIGQLDFYVKYFEENIKTEGDNPTIGIVLCSEKNETMVKYSILNENDHLYASKYKLYIPTEEELKKEIERERFNIEQRLEDNKEE